MWKSGSVPRNDPKSTATGGPKPVFSVQSGAGSEVSCAACNQRFDGCGPIGYRDDAPICDSCLIESDAELGMALALISVNRVYATISRQGSGEWLDPLLELGAFARLYELFAARSGPPRIFHVSGLIESEPAASSAPQESPRRNGGARPSRGSGKVDP